MTNGARFLHRPPPLRLCHFVLRTSNLELEKESLGVCKPDSVHPCGLCGHFSRAPRGSVPCRSRVQLIPGGLLAGKATLPLFVLHRAGFTMPSSSPPRRWALTPPFHPYPCGRFVFCGTFRPAGLNQPSLAFTRRAALGCPDFPLGACAPSGHPTPSGSAGEITRKRSE